MSSPDSPTPGKAPSPLHDPKPFEHIELAMGTGFSFHGRSPLSDGETSIILNQACAILHEADRIFSLYKPESPLSRLSRGETSVAQCPPVVNEIWDACEAWEKATDGWFSAFTPQHTFDPSGIVKTWAAKRAAEYVIEQGITDFTLNAGGDVLISDGAAEGIDWRMGISKPVSIAADDAGVLTVVNLAGTAFRAMATSGSAERGSHIWNPKFGGLIAADAKPERLVQVSVIANDLVTADVWATAAFAEGERAVERLNRVAEAGRAETGTRTIEALFVYADGQLAATDGFVSLFAKADS
jgi:thiamine biosynthesis lipoprotein